MQIWHLTDDAPRTPLRVSPRQHVTLTIGTWPIEPGQRVDVALRVERTSGARHEASIAATWHENRGSNSYWQASIGPFERGDKVSYDITGASQQGVTAGPSGSFKVGPKLHLALLWHQHQPVYKDTSSTSPRGSYVQPWVRLHALRDYYSMAAIVGQHPGVHLTINLTPSLLWQLDDYLLHGASDRSVEMSLRDPARLSSSERSLMIATFFDADRTHQIGIHPRYRELLSMRDEGRPFADSDLRDLAVWFTLAWFGHEFRVGDVQLVTGDRVGVRRFVEKQRGFDRNDVEALFDEQRKLMNAVVPIHRALQEEGQIEVATTPFFHPILPLLVDTSLATLDRPGTSLPRRFAHPEDADAQVAMAVDLYRAAFRRKPRGMWPAEGAVSQSVVPLFARARCRWVATDRGVLERSGKHGYRVDDPDVLCRPYLAEEGGHHVSVFFRDTRLSDDIGFVFGSFDNHDEAARSFVTSIKHRFAERLRGNDDRVLTVVVDGENAWGGYRDDGRPFLHALYALLESDEEIQTVTFAEFLEGNPSRAVLPHPPGDQPRVHDLFTGSWIDEAGSRPGVDLGTWIGEPEENDAWNLLGDARDRLAAIGATPQSHPEAFQALYIAEGSDWFWWFGDDQDSGRDHEFDDLFRLHLANIYRALGEPPPPRLAHPVVVRKTTWLFGTPDANVRPGDPLVVRTTTPGVLVFVDGEGTARETPLLPVGGVMSGAVHFAADVGSFPAERGSIEFVFHPAPPTGASAPLPPTRASLRVGSNVVQHA